MGIFINLCISKSVTKKEWEKVYEDTLKLIKHFPFAEKREVKVHGIDTVCLVKTEEHESTFGWNGKQTKVGWNAVGDYKYMRTAESYYLPRDLVGDSEVEPCAGDALMGALPAYMNYDWKDERFNHVYELWGNKTQGEPYHIYLLAVAALIEARLADKAFTYGDITRGQFKRAVEIANQYLDEPIEIPDRCNLERFFLRVAALPLEKHEQLAVFECLFLGTKDEKFADYMRQMFSDEEIAEYWKNRFENCAIGTIAFDKDINDYLLWGFDLKELCNYVNFLSKDGNLLYENFIKRIMEAKLYVEDKNCKDILEINQEEERPYGIGTLFARFAFAGCGNKKVNRYIPLDDIKSALNEVLGSKCNVEEIINSFLVGEAEKTDISLDASKEDFEKAVAQDPAEVFGQIMDDKKKKMIEQREKYDIDDYENLPSYEEGDILHPALKESLVVLIRFLDSLLEEDEYKRLLGRSAFQCCKWLADTNRYFLIRDEDWNKVFTNIEKDINSFGRYYSLFRVKSDGNGLIDMCKALMINDALYNYGRNLMTNQL